MDDFIFDIIDLQHTPDHLLISLHELQATVDATRFPADPPVALAHRLQEWKQGGHCRVALTPDRASVVGSTWVHVAQEDRERHVVGFNMQVLPQFRRRGVGRRLLRSVVELAQHEQRPLLMTQTQRSIPAGGAFMERIGARPSIESRSLQLVLDGYDPNLQHWYKRAQERASGWQVAFWDGAYPDADLEAIARLHEVHNDAPQRSESIGDRVVTPASLREAEHEMQAQEQRRLTAYVRNPQSGIPVGFSEVSWSEHDPGNVEQGTTAVVPAYRHRGLGHWLKAALLDKLMREQPRARFVRTGNAATNTAMLNVNAALGFKLISEDTWWEVERDRVEQYLGSASS